jgi:hypothetical protein
MVDQPGSQSVELRLAESGQELAAAIEAAQFARVLDRGAPEDPAGAAAIQAFIELFARAAEDWQGLGAAARARMLSELGQHLDALERCGWFVHWATAAIGVADPQQQSLRMPLAILSVSRSSAPALQARIPGALAIDPGSGAVH